VSREIVPAGGDPVSALKAIADDCMLNVVLSNHFVRYAVIAGSAALKSRRDWDAYAQHVFGATYGSDAAHWHIRISATNVPHERVACAVDRELMEPLLALPRVRSIQPYLMSAFNARRAAFASGDAWLVIQEPLRLTIALVERGHWKLIRVRQAPKAWQSALPDVLDREAEICGAFGCARAILCSEDEAPPRVGRYEVLDLSLPRKAGTEPRSHVMTLH